MLYRCDTPTGPVCDLVGVRLPSTYSLARVIAEKHAELSDQPVTVTQITNAGRLRPKATVSPAGVWARA